jgi:hypothetical protein
MNCTTCRYELSQCLDGRLPSGRRASSCSTRPCDDCGTFWAELQAAQQLTLRLQHPRVSGDFRESLWAAHPAGEGTPEAVFHEPVPMLAKLRYALTGAAAAAAALLCVTWLGPKDEGLTPRLVANADPADASPRPIVEAARGGNRANVVFHQDAPPIDESPLISSTQRLGFSLLASEAAKQLDNRYAAATGGLRRLNQPDAGDAVMQQVLANADEFLTFGELLLDMRDRERLLFKDANVELDLRFAVNMLNRGRHGSRDLQVVHDVVAPALSSHRLSAVSRTIAPVSLDPREEMDVLAHLNTQRPDIFPKLFIVLGSNDEFCQDLGLFRSGAAFVMEDDCGSSWVVPRSRADAQQGLLRIQRGRTSNGERVEVQIQVAEPRK